MNSRSVSDNLVNFSTDLATTLNQLDSKEPLLSFPFDHLYACSESGDRRQTLHLKEVEISTHCVVPHQEKHVTQRVASLESQNKKLKDLLIYHLDLIQQQNELMTKKEKAFQALRQENDTLKSKVSRAGVERQVAFVHHGFTPPLRAPVPATVATSFKSEVPSPPTQNLYRSSFDDLLTVSDPTPGPSPYLYTPSTSKNVDPFGLDLPPKTELSSFLSSDYVPSVLQVATLPAEVPPQPYTMVDSKRQKPKTVEPNNEPKYTVTTNSGNPKISRNRKRTTGIGSFSRMPKPKATPKQTKSTIYDDMFSVDTKMTYGKSKLSKYGYTALQARLQLIEPTPTGEDPYQIGEAEMREQSPIPKLMLQKTNHGRMRICSGAAGGVTSTITSTTPTRRIYDTMSSTTSASKAKRTKLTEDPYQASNMHVQSKIDSANASLEEDQELDVEKTDSELDWNILTSNKQKEISVCHFSYGESSSNLINLPLDISKMKFPDFFEPSPVNADSSDIAELEIVDPDQQVTENSKKLPETRTTSLAGPIDQETSAEMKRTPDTKRGRKRAHSTAASSKRGDNTQPKAPAKPRARRAIRVKKTPVAGKTTKKLYHTSMGDPDLSWYLGLDPDIKKEDCDTADNTTSNVEVPRWREKLYSCSYNPEGIENLDDKVFEKRHQKLEAEERRQLRWHMRRIREQRHVEKLRQRQRDPWGQNSAQAHSRGEYTVWPQPVRDLQYIEITDTLPVTAFGNDVPDLPKEMFELPWVRISKALKRSDRAKTLH